jgi:flagellar motor switch protein FliG
MADQLDSPDLQPLDPRQARPARPPRPGPGGRPARRPGQRAGEAEQAAEPGALPGQPRKEKRLSLSEKAAIIFLCFDGEIGAGFMQELDDVQIRKLTAALAGLGKVSAETVETVIAEFIANMQGNGEVVGSLRVAERFLRHFMTEEQVAQILNDLKGPIREHDIWKRLSGINDTTIANYLKGEHDQTAAAILSNLNSDVAARVLPMLGRERMDNILVRMIRMEAILPVTLQQIEQTLQADIMSGGGRPTTASEIQQKMAELFNKLERTLFEDLTESLEKRVPEEFAAIRQRMFTFNDMIKLDPTTIATILKGIRGTTLPMALRGSSKELRDHFLDALPLRAREMLVEEMNTMGAVRARDVSTAQSEIVDYARELAEKEVIFLPTGDEGDQLI